VWRSPKEIFKNLFHDTYQVYMKYTISNALTLICLLLAIMTHAQAPQGIPYQAVARNSSAAILASTNISVRFTIRDSIATGAIKYRETHSVTTTAQGMFSVTVGQGTAVAGTFAGINWGKNAKFMQVELAPAGGSSYTDVSTTQMMSVPYAMSSKYVKLKVSATGDTLYTGGGNFVIIPNLSMANEPFPVGMWYGGGRVAYHFVPGDPGYVAGETHGLIVAPMDQSAGIQWGTDGTPVGGTSTSLGTGAANTALISDAYGAGTAARLCADLVLGGYSDWYLPSQDELNKICINSSYIGGFASLFYWSSSVHPFGNVSITFMSGCSVGNHLPNSFPLHVRAVRSF
jgi:hypothetical protein